MKIIIATSRPWNECIVDELRKKLLCDILLITRKDQLNTDYLEQFSPDYIFFPHWSFIIPEEIYDRFQCIIFHMTDLPYGRGGSPLQNLISGGHQTTKISALKCVKELDAGPIYLKKDLSLHGSAQDIFVRARDVIKEMILDIIKQQIIPAPQEGEPIFFKRRKPEEGNLVNTKSLDSIYDNIRMLDAEGYPHAFIDCGNFIIEFTQAKHHLDGVSAYAYFKKK